MAWQYPTHSCGHHGERYQAYGHHTDRERKLAAIERQECPACRAMRAKAASDAVGLPQLIGSDKQIAWAVDIRERALRLHPELADKIKPETSAKWWIENYR